MNTYRFILILAVSMLVATLSVRSNTTEKKTESWSENSTFTLSGSVTNGEPNLSWSSVPGADEYVVSRFPIPVTGYSPASFSVPGTSFLDQGVDVVAQTGGFCQIRYTVKAYDEDETLLDTIIPLNSLPHQTPKS